MAMEAKDYKEMAVKIRTELECLEIEQENIERQIARLKQALVGLVPLSEPPVDSTIAAEVAAFVNETTLADAVRQILRAAESPLTPTEIKQKLVNMGKDLSGQKNVMASIHSLLKRLVESEEIESKENGLFYIWKFTYADKLVGRARSRDNAGAFPSPDSIKLWNAMKAKAIKNK
jgi:hypothetical protein